jgi:hypothetical protein
MRTDDKREGQPFQLLLSSKVALKLREVGWGGGVVNKKDVVVRLDCAPIFSVFHEFFGLRLLFSALCHLRETKLDGDHDRIYALEDSLAQLAALGLPVPATKLAKLLTHTTLLLSQPSNLPD